MEATLEEFLSQNYIECRGVFRHPITKVLDVYDENDKDLDWSLQLERLSLQEFRNLLSHPKNCYPHGDIVLNILATVLNLPIVVILHRHTIYGL